jgi:peptidoglycan hydrolase CwlO-like protein
MSDRVWIIDQAVGKLQMQVKEQQEEIDELTAKLAKNSEKVDALVKRVFDFLLPNYSEEEGGGR